MCTMADVPKQREKEKKKNKTICRKDSLKMLHRCKAPMPYSHSHTHSLSLLLGGARDSSSLAKVLVLSYLTLSAGNTRRRCQRLLSISAPPDQRRPISGREPQNTSPNPSFDDPPFSLSLSLSVVVACVGIQIKKSEAQNDARAKERERD